MRTIKNKILFTFLLIVIIINIIKVPALATENTITTYSPACILMDLNTGKILYSKNANEKMYPASTTKIMTAILTLERCKLTDKVTITHDAVYNVPSGYSIASLFEGEELTVDQLLHVLLIPSANDAAFALADHIGGNVEEFSNMMNKKAEEIGCKNTHFVNPNGIHKEEHYSTAYDLALIGQYAMKNDIFREIVSTTTYTLPTTNKYDKEDRIFNTTNELIRKNSKYYYQYATGAKTGYTEVAKSCIVATAKKDNKELIAVILHDEKTETGASAREVDCKNLFEYGFNNYELKTIAEAGSIQKSIKISNATRDTKTLDLILDKDISSLVTKEYNMSDINTNVILKDDIKAPIAKGEKVGTITFNVDGFDYTANLIASHDVFALDIKKTVLEITLMIILLWLFVSINNHRRNKRNRKKYARKSGSKKRKDKYLYYNFETYPRI